MAATAFQPAWLQVEDVKSWLRLNAQDSSDDDLLAAVAAMAEPYVERCRPEWRTTATVAAYLLSGVWQFNPTPGAVPASGQLTTDADVLTVASWLQLTTTDQLGVDYTEPLSTATHVLLQQQHMAGNWVSYGITAASDPIAGVVQLDVVFIAGAGDQQSAHWQTVVVSLTDSSQPVPGTYAPDAETYQGAVMYAAREYRRRNSPAGIETFGEVTSFVARFDPDIDRALQTGAYARPVVS